MKPIAIALDILQVEQSMYLGVQLPTLEVVLRSLDRISNSESSLKRVAKALRERVEVWFAKEMRSERHVMAAVLHPQFKVSWLNKRHQVELYARRRLAQIIDEEKAVVTASPSALPSPTPAADPHEDEMSAFFDIFGEDRMDDSGNTESFVTKYLAKPAGSSWKGEVLKPLFMKRLFIKYNTPLPSSAAVEPLFSAGNDILRPKRSRLGDTKFDKIMFLRANLNVKSLT